MHLLTLLWSFIAITITLAMAMLATAAANLSIENVDEKKKKDTTIEEIPAQLNAEVEFGA
uniref:Uncharacterized protein n=1 Tax=Romanomermis culicivorax TaxID=13658 RepID=A0A915K4Y9_ROMCU